MRAARGEMGGYIGRGASSLTSSSTPLSTNASSSNLSSHGLMTFGAVSGSTRFSPTTLTSARPDRHALVAINPPPEVGIAPLAGAHALEHVGRHGRVEVVDCEVICAAHGGRAKRSKRCIENDGRVRCAKRSVIGGDPGPTRLITP